ncbi:hypothetical protein V6N12_050614 [Hibiscus sabdariffa]|uniref:Reverse transcriptase Ty1/copia-type domain-containing protein n=1 Tax=Hibiscus sabdariffa TaxID=183260 RepID=A0ABR2GDI4_9ROSI
MIKSFRILLAIAAFHDYEFWQMDVKTAFLIEKIEEDVYMTQPEGFVTPRNAGKVCKLQRSIYGLKQASRSWNLRFNDAIKEIRFIKNEYEPCVYKKISGSIVSFQILHVDDILIIGNDIPTLQSIKTWLSSCFSMKDIGDASYILGVKIYRDRSRRLLGLSPSTYIYKVLKRFSMEESKRGFLPMRHVLELFGKEFPKFCSLVYSGGLSRDLDEIFVEIQDPSKWFHQENKSCDFLRVFLLGAFSPGFEERRSSFRDLTI